MNLMLDFSLLIKLQVRVYQGTSSSSTLVATYNGTSLPPVLTVAGPAVYIRFTTNSTGSTGWSLNYWSVGGTLLLFLSRLFANSDPVDIRLASATMQQHHTQLL